MDARGREGSRAGPGVARNAVIVATGRRGPGLWLVDLRGEGVVARGVRRWTRRGVWGPLSLSGAAGRRARRSDETADVLESMGLRSLSAAALEAVGVAQKALDLAMDYVKERKQFDKPIGAYQAVAHQVAEYVHGRRARAVAGLLGRVVRGRERRAGGRGGSGREVRRNRGRSDRVRAIHPGPRRYRLHVGAHPAPVLQARAVARSFEGFGSKQRKNIAGAILALR